MRELDYKQEALNLRTLGANLADFKLIVVPPLLKISPRHTCLPWIHPGRKITTLSPLAILGMDGAELAEELFRAYLTAILVDGFFHADPHPGNLFLTDDGRIALVDLGMVVACESLSARKTAAFHARDR